MVEWLPVVGSRDFVVANMHIHSAYMLKMGSITKML